MKSVDSVLFPPVVRGDVRGMDDTITRIINDKRKIVYCKLVAFAPEGMVCSFIIFILVETILFLEELFSNLPEVKVNDCNYLIRYII